jgi:hypothetical protein
VNLSDRDREWKLISAADWLHASQSTVSTRIHTLEDQLGCTLFVRNKAGTTLTSAGRQLQRHACVYRKPYPCRDVTESPKLAE